MSIASPAQQSPVHGPDLAALILAACAGESARAGGRLPTERELAAEFGVTRTSVRNALAILEAQGRISREVGRGTFLRTAVPSRSAGAGRAGSPTENVGPADVMAARRLLEPQVLPLVVAWATTRDFDEMRRCLEGGESAKTFEEFEFWDFALHHAIVAAGRNELVLEMYSAVESARRGAIWGNMKRRNDSRERRAAYVEDHANLVDALSARDLARAVDVMNTHLARVEANMLGSQRGSG
jgi:DNA-binding FadR family transcriptional regulator